VVAEPLELTLAAAEAGERLDRVLASRGLGFSRSTLQRFIAAGRVTMDGEIVEKDATAQEGATVRIIPAPPPPSTALPEDIPLDIVYEDEHLLVVNKPAGMVVHPAPGNMHGTLVNGLLHHRTVAPGADPLRPGIVHRLDKDTSGVMVVALTAPVREGLSALFASHDIERVYEAICAGHPSAAATFDTFHGRHPVDRKRFSSRVDRGKRAVTHMRLLEKLHASARVECQLSTGRTHQIRVHMTDHGHGLLGDQVYVTRSRDPRVSAAASALGRQALHARVLGFRHPATGETLRFESPPPEDFQAAARALRAG
jgi:23S rRNA pseudouridine1911/1915/1917 synthase